MVDSYEYSVAWIPINDLTTDPKTQLFASLEANSTETKRKMINGNIGIPRVLLEVR